MIDYINRQGFEALFDFIFYRQQTWKAYWDKYKAEGTLYWGAALTYETFPQKSGSMPPDHKSMNRFWWVFYWAAPPLHFLFGFFSRVALLPFTATVYVLSRTFLVVLNPLSWWNNTAKSAFMTLSFALPIFIALNNAYEWIPPYRFDALFAPAQLRAVSSAFGMSEGFWFIGSEVTGGFIAASLMMTVMAMGLYAAKKAAQSWNAVTFYDPNTDDKLLRIPVTVTAPKHAYYANKGMLPNNTELNNIAKAKGGAVSVASDPVTVLAITDNPYYDVNCAYLKLVYDYYSVEKKHVIDDPADTRLPFKRVLDKTDSVMKDHHNRKLVQESLNELIDLVKATEDGGEKSKSSRQGYLYAALVPRENPFFVKYNRLWRQTLGDTQTKPPQSKEPGQRVLRPQQGGTDDDAEDYRTFDPSTGRAGQWKRNQ